MPLLLITILKLTLLMLKMAVTVYTLTAQPLTRWRKTIFTTKMAYRQGVGLIVNESGEESNEIYRNWFTNLECGMAYRGKPEQEREKGYTVGCDCVLTDLDSVNPYFGNPFFGHPVRGFPRSKGEPPLTPRVWGNPGPFVVEPPGGIGS